MAETEKKISELTTASQINDTDLTILSQGSSGSGFASVKATILAIANKIVSGINFTSALQTTDKTITGAINEVAQGGGGGSSTLAGLSDVDIDTVTLDDGQGLVYDETEGKWVNGSSSGGGHTIVDNSGTSLAQEPKLKLNGMYVHDDSANQTTVGEYYREMTTAQYNQLSAVEKQGAIRLTDNPYVCNINEVENADATHIPYDSNISVEEAIDEVQESIAPIVESPTTSAISSGSHFMYNGVRMVATSAIASGATLVVYPTSGYNCKEDSVDNAIGNFITELAVNESVGVANNTSIIVAYGWSGLAAKGIIPLPSRYNLNSNYTYQMEIRNSTCNGMRIQNSPSFIDIVSKISKIDFYPNTNQAIFTFSTAPFGTSDGVVIIQGDFKITRKA